MDILNEYYPLYPPNPDREYSDGEIEDSSKRRRYLHYEDWYEKYSDDLWYLWCIINEYTDTNSSILLCNMEHSEFCHMCYNNSSHF